MHTYFRRILGGLTAGLIFASLLVLAGAAQAQEKKQPKAQTAVEQTVSDNPPNILFIMGDDIGFMQPRIYHRGLMVGETPNIDRIGQEGAIFMDYVAMQSCTSGRNAFFTGMYPLRTGLIPPQLPGSPSYFQPGTPALAKFLHDLGYTTGEFDKNHLGDHTAALPTAHGFQEYWGYLYHLDAMQQVSFPDINKSPTEQTVAPPCKNTPIPGVPEVPGAVDPKTTTCLTPPRNVLWCHSSDGTEKNQSCKDEGPLTLDRSRTVDEEISAKVVDFLDRNDPKKTGKPFFVWYNPARMHVTTVLPPKYEAMLGERGGKDWGVNEAGMKQMDDNIGYVLKKLEDTLDGFDQRDYLEGKSDKSARDAFFYYSGATPSAVRYKNWKMYYTMSQPGAEGWLLPLTSFHFTLVQNIKRDPFEQAVGVSQKTVNGIGGALGGPLTAFLYDWNMLPIGQQLWEKELYSYKEFPPLQAPETYNLTGILDAMKKAGHPSD